MVSHPGHVEGQGHAEASRVDCLDPVLDHYRYWIGGGNNRLPVDHHRRIDHGRRLPRLCAVTDHAVTLRQ